MTAHVDRARWVNQMAGEDMVNCTRYDGSCNVGLYFQILKILEFLEAHYR
jgi:hypothetical protein